MKKTEHVVIAGLVVLQLYSIVKINTLQRTIENSNYTIHSIENRLESQINSIYQSVDEKLEEQASLIHSSNIMIEKLDAATLAVPVTFTIEPKSVTETMSVFLDFNDEIIQLEKQGLHYSITKNLKISDNIFPKLIIDDNGVKSVEKHRDLNLSYIKENIFPNIYAHFSGSSSYRSNEYHENGSLNIDYKPSSENNSFIDVKYVVKIDERIIKETPVELSTYDKSSGAFTLDIDDKYPMNEGQILTANVVAIDSLGFTHEYLVTHFIAGKNMQREPYFEQVKITGPNGEVVHLFDDESMKK